MSGRLTATVLIMAREKKHSEERTLQLVHPVYLDVPMLVSFVAAAEDGFALESEQTEKGATATDRSREAGGALGPGSRASAPWLVSICRDASGEASRRRKAGKRRSYDSTLKRPSSTSSATR